MCAHLRVALFISFEQLRLCREEENNGKDNLPHKDWSETKQEKTLRERRLRTAPSREFHSNLFVVVVAGVVWSVRSYARKGWARDENIPMAMQDA